jgi:hypothetical protein
MEEHNDNDSEELVAWRAKNAEPIRRAINLIAPSIDLRAACCYDVETAMIELEYFTNQLPGRIKPAKLAADDLAKALRRVEVAMKNKNLDYEVQLFFPLSEVLKWKSKCEALAKTPPKRHRQKGAQEKKLAISAAYGLMIKYATLREREDTAEGSRFCKLAALLYGKPDVDLHLQCKAAVCEARKRKKSG